MHSRIRHWWRAVFRRGALENEMQTEMRDHLDRSTQRFIARGLPPQKARYAARQEFGVLGPLQEESRDAWGARWFDVLRRDLAFAFRALRSSPAFTIVAVLSLAIGIGGSTAIFTLIDSVILRSLPIERPEEMTLLRIKDPADGDKPGSPIFTNPMWEAVRDHAGDIASYAVSGTVNFNLSNGGVERPASALFVNGDFFRALGTPAAAGRLINTSDDYRGCPAVAVASYGFWQTELGGRTDAIDRTIPLNGLPFRLVGVAAPGFFGVDVGQSIQLYAPLCAEAIVRGPRSTLDRRSSWWLRVLARPKGGISLAQMNARLRLHSRPVFQSTVPQNYSAKGQEEYATQYLAAEPASGGMSFVRAQYTKPLYVLLGMVGVILLISCANVANLLLARGAARSREVAIRIAIGASRSRLIRQQLTESLLLAAVGGVIGVGIAAWGSRLLVTMLGGRNGAVTLDLSIDWRVLGFSALVSLATVVLFGLAPAWRGTRVDPQMAMKAGGRGNAEGHTRFGVGKALVIAQSALALVLVISAGLLVSTFRTLATADPGFHAEGVMITNVNFRALAPATYLATQRELLSRLRAMPGAREAALTDLTPVGGSTWNDFISVEGYSPAKGDDSLVWFNAVSDGYFTALGTPLIEGRDFLSTDGPNAPPVAIINEVVARQFFHGQSPVGRQYRIPAGGTLGTPVTIIGVVGVTKYSTLREPPQPIIFVSALQDTTSGGTATFVIRSTGSPSAVIAGVKSVAESIDPRIGLTFKPLSEQLAAALQRERLLATLSGFFGGVALLLAMIGLYGVMAYTVARRRVEIGIRIALGAVRSRVVQMVLGDVAVLIGAGIVIGIGGAYAATRLLGSLLFGVAPTDPWTIAMAVGVLSACALLAGAIPARRAAALEPVQALRED